jgi:LSD1 subclass zinc finger protein
MIYIARKQRCLESYTYGLFRLESNYICGKLLNLLQGSRYIKTVVCQCVTAPRLADETV